MRIWCEYGSDETHCYEEDDIDQRSVLSGLKSVCGCASIRDILRAYGTKVSYGKICKRCGGQK